MAGRAGASLTLSYLGAERSIPGYNVMGLAKASLEANVRFLAADLGRAGIRVNAHLGRARSRPCRRPASRDFARCSSHVAQVAPLRRNVTLEDVGNAAAFLCSDLAAGITGEILLRRQRLQHRGHELAPRSRRLKPPIIQRLWGSSSRSSCGALSR